jgi:MFS transporter, DHA1 family, inner membrane transport protein
MAAGSSLAFVPVLPIVPRLACALVGVLAGGAVPAAIMLSVPDAAPSPRLMATTQGLVMQGSSIGQLLGPVTVAAAGGVTGSAQAVALVFAFAVVPLAAARSLTARH